MIEIARINSSIIFFASGLALGVIAGFLVARLASWKRMKMAEIECARLKAGMEALEKAGNEMESMLAAAREERDTLQAKLIKAETELGILKENETRRAEWVQHLASRMEQAFATLGADALSKTSKDFLTLAEAIFHEREKTFEAKLRPLADAIERYESGIRELERARQRDYGAIKEQVGSLMDAQVNLAKETARLVHALRRPQVRGRWGEMTLRRVVEIAGMQEHCDFYQQVSFSSRDGGARPDMIITLPGERRIVVDAKVSLSAYLDSLEAQDQKAVYTCIKEHARQVREHVTRLSKKNYWAKLPYSPEFTVMFLPGENFFASAVTEDPSLIEDAAARGVIIATPTTLIGMLKAVAFAWRQESTWKNAEEILQLGTELYDRIAGLAKHFHQLGHDLEKSVESYNRAIGSFERRVLVSARRFSALSSGSNGAGKSLRSPLPLSVTTRKPDIGK